MKHIVKLLALLVAVSAFWIGLLETVIPHSYAWLLPVYFVVSLGCYGLLMVGVGLLHFYGFELLLMEDGTIYFY
ncbi:hypothetical protein ACB092_01G191300 [Castanea dentata]